MVLDLHDRRRILAAGFAALTAFAGAVLLICGGWYAAGCAAAVLIAVGYGYTVHICRKTASGKLDESNRGNAPDREQERER